MGATNCPETPRQKMIGMMYLFYTALLALNVSNEVIEAFIYVNESLEATSETYLEKSQQSYAEIHSMYDMQPQKFENQWLSAQQIKSSSDSLYGYINEIKFEIMKVSTKTDTISSIEFVKKKDDVNAANEVMIAEMGPRMGYELEKKVDAYRDGLLSFVADTSGTGSFLKSIIVSALATEEREGAHDDSPKPWPETLSKGVPLIATYALLTKLQADIRNVESDMYSYLIGDAEKLDIKISELKALVAAPGAIMPGSRFNGQVFIGAQDTTMIPVIWITYTAPYYDSTINEDGQIIYKKIDGRTDYVQMALDESGAGVIDTTFAASGGFGGIAIWESNLGPKIMAFKQDYTVGASSGAITPTKMMVLYAGLANPIQYAASGGAGSKPFLSASNGLSVISTGGNTATITPPSSLVGQKVTLTVNARNDDGTTTRGTSQVFEIRRTPNPVLYLAGVQGGVIDVNRLINGQVTGTPDPSFVFQGVHYTIQSLTIRYKSRGQSTVSTVSGSSISANPTVAQSVRSLGRGSMIFIEKVKVVTPDGVREIPGPSFEIL